MNKPTCCIHECEKPVASILLCGIHYYRLHRYGSTKPRVKPKKICRMPGCEKPSRKLRWCSMHHSRIKRTGSPFDHAQAWTLGERVDCIVCGEPTLEGSGFRRYCSHACAVIKFRGPRITETACMQCGSAIDLTVRHASGRLKYASTSFCSNCKKPTNLRRFIPAIVARDGMDCGICQKAVDLNLAYPDYDSPSVDHAIPRSLGGPDAIENFRLTHFICNVRRQNRVDVAA